MFICKACSITGRMSHVEATIVGLETDVKVNLEQCRFCLADAPADELVAPCRCEGTARFVHETCLLRWQQQVAGTRNESQALVCQSCLAPFVLLGPVQRPTPVSKPAPSSPFRRFFCCFWRLPHQQESGEPTAVFSVASRPIFENISTNPNFDPSDARRLPDRKRQQLQAMIRPGCLILRSPHASPPIMRAEHWNQGAFLIAGVWFADRDEDSAALIGVNLLGSPIEAGGNGRLADTSLQDLKEHLSYLHIPLISGGPVKPQRVLALLVFEGRPAMPLPALVVMVRTWEELPGQFIGAFFGEARDVHRLLQVEPDLRVLRGVAFRGHAVWSSLQLCAEIGRGNWGLAQAHVTDYGVATVPQERRNEWRQLWQTRQPLH
eukprot:TRINITY_DN23061_c0_g2_i1.p1 TRINITY_DN23061_c0_g2~~TRINITY_DN23061_c0_g2_i1.p1  ORF type:complete len:378 (-),score=29.73 TRINITY_DN23061_c0_g2_i1:97-1230(-)